MKITKTRLKRIIKEELSKTLKESDLKDAIYEYHYNLKSEIGKQLVAKYGDWVMEDWTGWGDVTYITDDFEYFKEEIEGFLGNMQLGSLEDLEKLLNQARVPLEPYEKTYFG